MGKKGRKEESKILCWKSLGNRGSRGRKNNTVKINCCEYKYLFFASYLYGSWEMSMTKTFYYYLCSVVKCNTTFTIPTPYTPPCRHSGRLMPLCIIITVKHNFGAAALRLKIIRSTWSWKYWTLKYLRIGWNDPRSRIIWMRFRWFFLKHWRLVLTGVQIPRTDSAGSSELWRIKLSKPGFIFWEIIWLRRNRRDLK